MSLTDLMSGAGLTLYPILALAIFLAVFAVITARTFAPARREQLRDAGRLPLHEDTIAPSPRGDHR